MRKRRGPNANPAAKHDHSNCEVCRNDVEFEVPTHLLDQLTAGNIAIFAGAGVSTETTTVFSSTFYQEVLHELGASATGQESFPDLMTSYCQLPDGRQRLLQKLRKRLEYVKSFPEIYRVATRFHRELASLFYIDTYITTNWDNYFEEECGATPFVNDTDFAFWNAQGRKVLKIHGSASNFGSLIATNEDYSKARKSLEKGQLGAALKLTLATKTIVYVGYSFSDHDFLSIHRSLFSGLGKATPTAYIVSIDRMAETRFRTLGLTPIFTDATHFVRMLKKHIQHDGHFLSDERFSAIPELLERTRREHRSLLDAFLARETPEILYCAAYQDGLIHALERILARYHTGDYSHICDVNKLVTKYDQIGKDRLKAKRYHDVAYAEGYSNALLYLVAHDRERKALPLYFCFGSEGQPRTLAQYKTLLKQLKPHRAAAAFARNFVNKNLGPHDEPHHTPFL